MNDKRLQFPAIVLTTAIALLAGSAVVLGQNGPGPCPSVTVTADKNELVAGDTVHFVAALGTGASIDGYELNWDVTTGIIDEGQGTPKIGVSTTADMGERSVVATVTIKGINNGCFRSSTTSIPVITIEIIDPDKFGRLDRHEIQGLIDNVTVQLNNNPSYELFISLEFDETDGHRDKLARVKAIIDAAKRRDFDPARATLAIARKPTVHDTASI